MITEDDIVIGKTLYYHKRWIHPDREWFNTPGYYAYVMDVDNDKKTAEIAYLPDRSRNWYVKTTPVTFKSLLSKSKENFAGFNFMLGGVRKKYDGKLDTIV